MQTEDEQARSLVKRSEALGLTWGHLDLDFCTLKVRQTLLLRREMSNTNKMQGHHEAVPSGFTKTPNKLLLEHRHANRKMARLLKDRYFWYVVTFAVFLGIFTYAADIAALSGLAPREDWELTYYVALHRFLFQTRLNIVWT